MTSSSPSPAPREPITPPPAPQRFSAPHNLYTLTEIIVALRRLEAGGLRPHQEPRVRINWGNGADSSVSLDDLDQLTAVEDVHEMWLFWTYSDGSTVTGNLLNRPQAGSLKVENGGRALAAATGCLEVLRNLRQQRSRVRAFLAGQGPLWSVSVAFLALSITSFIAGGDISYTSISVAVWIGVFAAAIIMAVLLNALFAWTRRRMGGTRLAQPSDAHRQLMTAELGVLATAIGPPIALVALLVSILAL